MSILWHPALRADWLVLRRTGAIAFVRILGVPVLLLTCCAALACGDFYRGYGWCLAAAALLALGGSHAIAHQGLLDALERWQLGWCAALPVARGAAARTLLLITIVALTASLVIVTVLLLAFRSVLRIAETCRTRSPGSRLHSSRARRSRSCACSAAAHLRRITQTASANPCWQRNG